MKLTIAIAIYNGEKYIDRCIKSIKVALDRSPIDLEVLAINDGSTDSSLEILNNYSKSFSWIKVINKENGGPGSVRNLSIYKATGDLLWMIDVDDEVIESSLDTIVNNAKSDINMFNYSEYSSLGVKEFYENIVDDYNFTLNNKKEFILNAGSTWKFIFKTEFLKKSNILFKEMLIYEDLNFTAKVFLSSESISTFNIPIYKYYINDNSIMTSKSIKRKRDILVVLDDIKKYYLENEAFYNYYKELEYLYIHHMLYVAYVSIITLDKKNILLDKLLGCVNDEFGDWEYNKYLLQQNIIKRLILKFIKKDKKHVVVILLKFKKYLIRFIKK